MTEILVPQTIKIGGYDYEVFFDAEHDKLLDPIEADGLSSNREQYIIVRSTSCKQQSNNILLHEILHQVADNYLGDIKALSENQVTVIANGLHQVFDGLGIHFTFNKEQKGD